MYDGHCISFGQPKENEELKHLSQVNAMNGLDCTEPMVTIHKDQVSMLKSH